jgi:hypothetical protein
MPFEQTLARNDAFEHLGLAPYNSELDITQPGWDCEPLIIHRIGPKNQQLLFVAVRHSNIVEDNPHYQTVTDMAKYFIRETIDKPRVVVVEGGIRTCSTTPDDSYRLGGEGALATWYASQHSIEQRCFEPVHQGAGYLLTQGFTHTEIATYLFARFVPSWYRRFQSGSTEGFEEYIHERLTCTGNLLFDWPDFMLKYDYNALKSMYKTIYGTDFTPENPATVQFLFEETTAYMQPPRSRIHQVAIEANRARDVNLARGLRTLWQSGVSAFVPYGYPHGVTLQSFIASL